MSSVQQPRRAPLASLIPLSLAALAAAACAHRPSTMATASSSSGMPSVASAAQGVDPRVGLKAGLYDAGEAVSGLRVLSETRPSPQFEGQTNSDLAFTGPYVIQGSYNGWQIWDISTPTAPKLATAYVCPASQSDVSVYKNLLFVSGEGLTGRIDCGTQGVQDTVSKDRLRGIRIFDITDIQHPRNVGNVQTCRGSHTHTLLVDPKDTANVYIYVSGSSGVRSPNELAGCSAAAPSTDPNSALFRIEVIKVPVAHPEQAAIVSSPRIFNDLVAPPRHGEMPQDVAEAARRAAAARAQGKFTASIRGSEMVLPDRFAQGLLDSLVHARGGSGAATAQDSATLRANVQSIIDARFGSNTGPGPHPGPTQCHDITVYPAIGRAGGACEGYGLLLDISDPAHPRRLAAVADSNFSYWHSATFNNDGTKVLFSDEWGGGGQPKCRATDRKEWGADAIFTISGDQLQFQSYYKMPAPQTSLENCVAHNGSLIPIPGRDVMVQAWYQGGISVFDWTDAAHPKEIAFFDRGPADSTRMALGGSWSVYWYNGAIVSSEIARGLDVFALAPSPWISQNEIDAANTVHLDYLNAQGQPHFSWPNSFALARAYVDQLERSKGLSSRDVSKVRDELKEAEANSGSKRRDELGEVAKLLDGAAGSSSDAAKVQKLAGAVRALGAM